MEITVQDLLAKIGLLTLTNEHLTIQVQNLEAELARKNNEDPGEVPSPDPEPGPRQGDDEEKGPGSTAPS